MTSSQESSISVMVRIRPFSETERAKILSAEENFNAYHNDNDENHFNRLLNIKPIRKVIQVVDDRMLIFDPHSSTNSLRAIGNHMDHKETGDKEKRVRAKRSSHVGKHSTRNKEHRYIFDKLFDEDVTQQEVFINTGRAALDSILDGFNSTIFAYGATGCGKTHTISGTPEAPGLIFLTIANLFDRINDLQDTHTFDVSLTYLEIYNEKLVDLLVGGEDDNMDDPSMSKPLIIREDENKKVSVVNISIHKPTCVEEAMELISRGNRKRFVCATEANQVSSRSHAVLQIDVFKKSKTAALDEEQVSATLSIIDLAGSERASSTRNKGVRLHEGANINKSLLSLGNCINALCDPRKRNHIPYRDSNLTRLLKFSLGGNCKTIMIVCISPSSAHYDETLNSLKYADRAKQIKTKVSRNKRDLQRHVITYSKIIEEQQAQIEDLKNNMSRITQIHVQRHISSRDICSQRLLASIEELEKSIEKNQHLKLQKAYIVAHRSFLLSQRVWFNELITNLEETFSVNEINFAELDIDLSMKKLGLKDLFMLLYEVKEKINTKIQNLELEYNMPTDIDYILTESVSHILQSLQQLEGWSDLDSKMFDKAVKLLKDSVEGSIMFNSNLIFERMITKAKTHSGDSLAVMTRTLQIFIGMVGSSQQANHGDGLFDTLKEIMRQITGCLQEILDVGFELKVEISEEENELSGMSTLDISYIKDKRHETESTPLNQAISISTTTPASSPASAQKRSSTSPLIRAYTKRPLLPAMHSPSNGSTKTTSGKKVTWGSFSHIDEADVESSINEENLRASMKLGNSFDNSSLEIKDVIPPYTDLSKYDSPTAAMLPSDDELNLNNNTKEKEKPIRALKFGSFPSTSLVSGNPRLQDRFKVGTLTRSNSSIDSLPLSSKTVNIQPIAIQKSSLGNSSSSLDTSILAELPQSVQQEENGETDEGMVD